MSKKTMGKVNNKKDIENESGSLLTDNTNHQSHAHSTADSEVELQEVAGLFFVPSAPRTHHKVINSLYFAIVCCFILVLNTNTGIITNRYK